MCKDYKSISKIIIVDNASTDNSYKILKKLENDKLGGLKTDA